MCFRKVGFSSGLTLQGSVHPELAQSGDLVGLFFFLTLSGGGGRRSRPRTRFRLFFQTVKAIEEFGAVIEELLVKHGKKIIGSSGLWSFSTIIIVKPASKEQRSYLT